MKKLLAIIKHYSSDDNVCAFDMWDLQHAYQSSAKGYDTVAR